MHSNILFHNYVNYSSHFSPQLWFLDGDACLFFNEVSSRFRYKHLDLKEV